MGKAERMACLAAAAAALLLAFMAGRISLAAEQAGTETGQVYQVSVDTQLREKGETGAKEVADVPAGSVVMVTSPDDGGGWCEVSCGEEKGYIQTAALAPVVDVEALDQEFNNIANDYENTYEEVLEIQKQRQTSRIWGGIIVALVAAIFAVGIVSAVKKKDDGTKEGTEGKA